MPTLHHVYTNIRRMLPSLCQAVCLLIIGWASARLLAAQFSTGELTVRVLDDANRLTKIETRLDFITDQLGWITKLGYAIILGSATQVFGLVWKKRP